MSVRAIAGVIQTGKRRGDIIEMSHEQKTIAALKEALANPKDDWGKPLEGSLNFATNIVVNSIEVTANGGLIRKKWQNNSYVARGSLDINKRILKDDTLKPPQKNEFFIKFNDLEDQYGHPTLRVSDLKLNRF